MFADALDSFGLARLRTDRVRAFLTGTPPRLAAVKIAPNLTPATSSTMGLWNAKEADAKDVAGSLSGQTARCRWTSACRSG